MKKVATFHPMIWNRSTIGILMVNGLSSSLAACDHDCDEHDELPDRKLSAVYEFAKAMPLLFVPASHKVGDKKRKR